MPSSIESALVVALLVIPGFVTRIVYARLALAAKSTDAHRLMLTLLYGAWNLLVVLSAGCLTGGTAHLVAWGDARHVASLSDAIREMAGERHVVQLGVSVCALLVCFLLPAVWGYVLSLLVNWGRLQRAIDDHLRPEHTWLPGSTWDWLAYRMPWEWMRVSLKDGRCVQGMVAAIATTDDGGDLCLRKVKWWSPEKNKWLPHAVTHYLYLPSDSIALMEYVRAPSPEA